MNRCPFLFVIPSEAEGSAVLRTSPGNAEPQIPRLRSPGFPVEIGGVGELHVPFLARKGTHATVSSATWQEIRLGMTKGNGNGFIKSGC